MRTPGEPLIGEELIRVSLETHHLHMEFTDTVLQIGAPFRLSGDSGDLGTTEPLSKSSTVLATIWSLVGKTVSSATWEPSVEINFDNGIKLEIGPWNGAPRGTILSRHGMQIEDF